LTPIQAGETRRAPVFFLNVDEARRRFPAGARFWSFDMEGRVLNWLSMPATTAAE